MRRTLYGAEHRDFRESFEQFVGAEVAPHHEQWERDGIVPREVFKAAGGRGFLAFDVPEEYGGAGVADFRFNAIVGEVGHAAGLSGFAAGLTLHSDICVPYFLAYATAEQQARWLPGIASGELITAIAMSEPGTGSDLAGIATRAVLDGDTYVVNGSKTFVTNGINADLVITVVRTDHASSHGGLSLLVTERGTPGFERGRKLEKLGMHAQDTAELFFSDALVPAANRLGDEGAGFRLLTSNLPQERLSIAVAAIASARAALDYTVAYVKERRAFGQSIGSFQNTRFVLAELWTDLELAQTFVDRCIELTCEGALGGDDAAMAKWWTTELQGRVMDRCLQLHGGYGYMLEYPIARAFVDARVSRIYGGTNEIMKEIVGRSLGL
jgi:alkylation response protein AidB-like acyl-CoA dehydrogenase